MRVHWRRWRGRGTRKVLGTHDHRIQVLLRSKKCENLSLGNVNWHTALRPRIIVAGSKYEPDCEYSIGTIGGDEGTLEWSETKDMTVSSWDCFNSFSDVSEQWPASEASESIVVAARVIFREPDRDEREILAWFSGLPQQSDFVSVARSSFRIDRERMSSERPSVDLKLSEEVKANGSPDLSSRWWEVSGERGKIEDDIRKADVFWGALKPGTYIMSECESEPRKPDMLAGRSLSSWNPAVGSPSIEAVSRHWIGAP